AGLQAIATALRLGAVVSGFDVRPVVKEQVDSLGAVFLDLGVRGEETAGGYATELTPEQQARQQAELEKRLPDFDVVITTAAIPGRPAPKLIPASAVAAMPRLGDRRPGRRDRRQLRADEARRGDRRARRLDRRLHEPAEHHADPCEPAVRAQRGGAPLPPRAGRRAEARLRGRDHGRSVRDSQGGVGVTASFLVQLTVLVLAAFLGVEVISKVPTLLHTPLMSGTNAIHGIVLVGAIIVAAYPHQATWIHVVALVAVALGTGNVVGGFV